MLRANLGGTTGKPLVPYEEGREAFFIVAPLLSSNQASGFMCIGERSSLHQ